MHTALTESPIHVFQKNPRHFALVILRHLVIEFLLKYKRHLTIIKSTTKHVLLNPNRLLFQGPYINTWSSNKMIQALPQ